MLSTALSTYYLNDCFTCLFSYLDHELLKSPDLFLHLCSCRTSAHGQWSVMVEKGRERNKTNCISIFSIISHFLPPHFMSSYYFSPTPNTTSLYFSSWFQRKPWFSISPLRPLQLQKCWSRAWVAQASESLLLGIAKKGFVLTGPGLVSILPRLCLSWGLLTCFSFA